MNWAQLRANALPLLVALALGWFLFRRLGGSDSDLVGQPAPDFTFQVVAGEGADEGDRMRLADLKGQVVVLDFWASWCGPCRASIPDMSELATKYAGQGVRFIGINGESLAPTAYRLIEKSWGFRYPLVSDSQNTAHLAYGVQAFPTVAVIDRDQVIRYGISGVPTKARLEREIRNVLK